MASKRSASVLPLFRLVHRRLCSKAPRRVFSGIQPTGVPHLGNYLGAIRPWLALQQAKAPPFVSIVDLHALTTASQDPVDVGRRTLELAAVLLACGLDPEQGCVIFQQSAVRGHTELAWILACLCPLARLEAQPQWRERKAALPPSALSLGLLSYPVLQAADILLYRATEVPVGEDQEKHLELARLMVDRFHSRYQSDLFHRPRTLLATGEARISSLRRPDKKMSKSDAETGGRIELSDSDEAVRKKIRAAVTDSEAGVSFDPEGRPGVSNLIRIAAALRGETVESAAARLEASNKIALKDHVTETVLTWLRPIRDRFEQLSARPEEVRAALDKGNRAAQVEADRTMELVRRAMRLEA